MPINWLQLGTGAGLMVAGLAIHGLAPAAMAWELASITDDAPFDTWVARAAGAAPTFVHVAAMSLLTAGALGGTQRAAWVAALAWMTTDIFFELGQYPPLRVHLIGSIPAWLEHLWLFNSTRTQFLNAFFDAIDIVAAMLGGLAALVAILRMRPAGAAT